MDTGAFNNRTFKTALAMIKFNLSSCEGVDRSLAEVHPVALDVSRRRNYPQHSLRPQFLDASLAAQPASFSGLQNEDTPSENAVIHSYPYPSQNFTWRIQHEDSLSEYPVDSMYISPSTLRMGNTSEDIYQASQSFYPCVSTLDIPVGGYQTREFRYSSVDQDQVGAEFWNFNGEIYDWCR